MEVKTKNLMNASGDDILNSLHEEYYKNIIYDKALSKTKNYDKAQELYQKIKEEVLDK